MAPARKALRVPRRCFGRRDDSPSELATADHTA